MNLLDRLSELALQNHSPFEGQFELTPSCNFSCKMCFLNGAVRSEHFSVRPASFWLRTAEQAKEMGMMVLSISGGEPLLHPEIRELMEGLNKMGLLISFNTNGSMITEEIREWFRQYPVTKINITLYGASPDTYESLCGNRSAYERVVHAIDGLLEDGQNVYLNAVVTPENVHELPEMQKFAEDRGLTLHTPSYLYPALGAPDHRQTPEDAAGTEWKLRYADNPSKRREKQILLKAAECSGCNGCMDRCNSGKILFTVTYDGRMVPCVMLRHISCDLKENSFEQGWEFIKESMKEFTVPEKCSKCIYADTLCPACKASLYLEEKNGTPDYLCRFCEELHRKLKGI